MSGGDAEQPGSPTSHREVERKFRVYALFELPDLAAVPGVAAVESQPVRSMDAVYHDTADLALFRWGITLRRREGGPDQGWHIKFPVVGDVPGVRDELQLPLDEGAVGQVPAQIQDLVTALTRGEPLIPVAKLHTERSPWIIGDADGQPALEVVDDTVSIMQGEQVAARFREIEVEALTEDAENAPLLTQVCDAIQAAGGTPGTMSKAASAVGPRASQPPDIPRPPAACPEDPARMAVQAHLARQARRFLLQDVRVRRDLPDSVHQMRVAARRLRSGLQTFGPLVDAQWARHLRTELGWIAGELGAVRDTEVMIERLDQHARQLTDAESVLAQSAVDQVLGIQITDARAHALGALRSERYRQLLVDLVAGVRDPLFTQVADQTCAAALPALVDKAWRRLAKDVDRLKLHGEAAPWHEARIAAKKARYAAEAMEPVFGDSARPLARALEQVTELLGDHQDSHVAQNTLMHIAEDRGLDARTGFALGLLYNYELDYEMSLRHRFRKTWPLVAKTHRKTRLGGG